MLPRLEAEEMLERINAAALGGGNVAKGTAQRIMGQLRRLISPPRPVQTLDDIRASGIQVVEEVRKP